MVVIREGDGIMNTQPHPDRVSSPKRRGRGCLIWLGGLVAALLGLLLLGARYESVSEARDRRGYPPPGQLVEVGGYRLHIHCTGQGSPTVVIDSGWGDMSASWAWVQPDVAR